MDFTSKRVLITGGTRGIGRACAQAFASCGASVALNFKGNTDTAQKTLDELPGGPHTIIKADVANPDAVRAMIDKVVKELGGLDIVVNNAGVSQYHDMDAIDYGGWQQAWRQTMAVNVYGPANVMYCAAQYMKKSGGGRIVNVSSRGAFRGEPDKPAYGASKAALNAMSQSLAQKLAKHHIYIGVVAPGFVETELSAQALSGPAGEHIRRQSPLERVAKPEEVAYAVLFLASEGSEFSTGTIIDVNGASYLRS